MVSRKFGKIHEHTRTIEAKKIELEQAEYKQIIARLVSEKEILETKLNQIDEILITDELKMLFAESSNLKSRILSWIFQVDTLKPENTTRSDLD